MLISAKKVRFSARINRPSDMGTRIPHSSLAAHSFLFRNRQR